MPREQQTQTRHPGQQPDDDEAGQEPAVGVGPQEHQGDPGQGPRGVQASSQVSPGDQGKEQCEEEEGEQLRPKGHHRGDSAPCEGEHDDDLQQVARRRPSHPEDAGEKPRHQEQAEEPKAEGAPVRPGEGDENLAEPGVADPLKNGVDRLMEPEGVGIGVRPQELTALERVLAKTDVAPEVRVG